MSVPPLTFKTKNTGKPYRRHADVELAIQNALAQPRQEWVGIAIQAGPNRLPDEALVHLIRVARADDADLTGALIGQLGKRTARHTKKWLGGLDELSAEEIAETVIHDVIKTLLAPLPTRASEFLEVAFGKAVQRRTLNAIIKRKFVLRHQQTPVDQSADYDGDGDDSSGTTDSCTDSTPDPTELIAELEDTRTRRELLRIAQRACKNPLHYEALFLRYGRGWPVTAPDPEPSLCTHFKKSDRQIRNWMRAALRDVRKALGVKT